MTDRLEDTGNGKVTTAVLSYQLKEIDKKLVILMSDHDTLVRMQVQVEQNKDDISGLADTARERDKARRKESLAEMFLAALIGASSWIRPV